MVNGGNQKLSLDQMATYEIRIPGQLEASWLAWTDRITITVKEVDGSQVSLLTGDFDQAALQGLLRRLYALGLPLISVVWVRED